MGHHGPRTHLPLELKVGALPRKAFRTQDKPTQRMYLLSRPQQNYQALSGLREAMTKIKLYIRFSRIYSGSK